jgi:hypothetical protein
VRRRLDLARVARADGGDRVGELQAGLEHRQLAPELDAVHAAPVVRHAQQRRRWPWEHALERQVVDGDDAGRRRLVRQDRARARQVQRRHAAGPVVGVHHVGGPAAQGRMHRAQLRSHCDRKPKRKALSG